MQASGPSVPTPGWRPSPWAVAGTVGVMAVLCALTLASSLTSPAPEAPPVALSVAVGVVALGLVPALFHRPVPAAAALAVLAAVVPTAVPPATAGTYVVGRVLPLPTAVAVAVLGAAGHVVRGLLRPVHGLSFGWWVVLVLVAQAALLAVGALGQARAHVITGLAERAERAERDRDLVVAEAVAAERTRIAREMHDVLAHRLSLLATYAGALEYRPDTSPEKLAQAAGVVRDGVHQALEEVRDVVGVLRDEPGDHEVPPPSPDLDQLTDLVREAGAAGSEVDVVGRTVYRLAQEGLTNARKHAPGAPVRVAVTGRAGDGVEVEVTNPLGSAATTSSEMTLTVGCHCGSVRVVETTCLGRPLRVAATGSSVAVTRGQ